MISLTRERRFGGLAERELHAGPRREPIWQQALADTSNNPTQAENLYRQRRVAQMIADEEDFAAASNNIAAQRRFSDEGGWGIAKKNGLLGLGIIVVLLTALIWLLR